MIQNEEDHLDDYLDRLATDPAYSYAPNGDASKATVSARTFYALDASDRGADPRSAFVAQLKEQLMLNDASLALPAWNGSRIPSRRDDKRMRAPASTVPANHWLSRTRQTHWLATTGLLLVIVLFVALSFRGNNGHKDERPGFAATPESVASLGFEPVDISECTTTARPTGSVKSLIGQTPSRVAILPDYRIKQTQGTKELLDVNSLLSGLPEADASTLDGIEDTISEATACRFYYNPSPYDRDNESHYIGLDGRFGALYSDDFYRREADNWQSPAGPDATASNYWVPLGPQSWNVDDARALPDGRVVAIISTFEDYPYPPSMALVLAKEGDSWLIDEVTPVRIGTLGSSQGPDPQFLELGFDDYEGFVGVSDLVLVNGVPSLDTFYSDRPLIITLANSGSHVQEVRIEQLGIQQRVEPGHSISFSITPPPGPYVLSTYDVDPQTGEPTYRRVQQVINIEGGGTPVGVG